MLKKIIVLACLFVCLGSIAYSEQMPFKPYGVTSIKPSGWQNTFDSYNDMHLGLNFNWFAVKLNSRTGLLERYYIKDDMGKRILLLSNTGNAISVTINGSVLYKQLNIDGTDLTAYNNILGGTGPTIYTIRGGFLSNNANNQFCRISLAESASSENVTYTKDCFPVTLPYTEAVALTVQNKSATEYCFPYYADQVWLPAEGGYRKKIGVVCYNQSGTSTSSREMDVTSLDRPLGEIDGLAIVNRGGDQFDYYLSSRAQPTLYSITPSSITPISIDTAGTNISGEWSSVGPMALADGFIYRVMCGSDAPLNATELCYLVKISTDTNTAVEKILLNSNRYDKLYISKDSKSKPLFHLSNRIWPMKIEIYGYPTSTTTSPVLIRTITGTSYTKIIAPFEAILTPDGALMAFFNTKGYDINFSSTYLPIDLGDDVVKNGLSGRFIGNFLFAGGNIGSWTDGIAPLNAWFISKYQKNISTKKYDKIQEKTLNFEQYGYPENATQATCHPLKPYIFIVDQNRAIISLECDSGKWMRLINFNDGSALTRWTQVYGLQGLQEKNGYIYFYVKPELFWGGIYKYPLPATTSPTQVWEYTHIDKIHLETYCGHSMFDGPSSFSVDNEGRYYILPIDIADVSNDSADVILEFEPFNGEGYGSATFLGCFGSAGRAKGEFDGIVKILMDSINRLYVVEQTNHRYQIFSPLPDADRDGDPDSEDCSPSNPAISHRLSELCGDSIDNNCDGLIDIQDPKFARLGEACGGVAPCPDTGTLICAPDKKDLVCSGNNIPHDEICGNDIDEDCNGVDLSCNDVDNDNDGFTENQGDCNDIDPLVHPGATEICENEIDEDCNGQDVPCALPVVKQLSSGKTGIDQELFDVEFSKGVSNVSGDNLFIATETCEKGKALSANIYCSDSTHCSLELSSSLLKDKEYLFCIIGKDQDSQNGIAYYDEFPLKTLIINFTALDLPKEGNKEPEEPSSEEVLDGGDTGSNTGSNEQGPSSTGTETNGSGGASSGSGGGCSLVPQRI